MQITVDEEPFPPPANTTAFTAALRGLAPGQSMLVERAMSYNAIKVTVSRIKKENPGSLYTVRKVGMGDVRVWRLV